MNTNILYVDDEPHNLSAFAATYRRLYKVFTAESAKEGRKILDREDIHIVITDQRMPKTTGVEFLASILEAHPDPIRRPVPEVRPSHLRPHRGLDHFQHRGLHSPEAIGLHDSRRYLRRVAGHQRLRHDFRP